MSATGLRKSNKISNSSDISNKLIKTPAKKVSSKTSIGSSINSNDNYDTGSYNIGVTIYRGDKIMKKQNAHDSAGVPVFFADKKHALVYTPDYDPKYLKEFTFKKMPTLFVLSYNNLDVLKKDVRLTAEERDALNLYYNTNNVDKYIWPVGYLHKEDAFLQHKLYLNRRIANILCRLGFDGWVSEKGTLKQKNLNSTYYTKHMDELVQDQELDELKQIIIDVMKDSQYSKEDKNNIIGNIMQEMQIEPKALKNLISTNHVKYKINEYKPEIVICKWQNVLKVASRRLIQSI